MKRFLPLIPVLLSLCSCWDYTEPNMQNYVLGMSIDYINSEYVVCIETVKITGEPASLSASEGVIVESRGITIFDAVRNAISTAGKKLYWGHTELIVISEAVARDHLSSVEDIIERSQDIYSNVDLIVAKDCLARDVLNGETPRGMMSSVHIVNILENEEPSRRFKRCELWQLQRDFPYTLLPTVSLDDSPIVEGGAVIANGALVGYLNGDETQIFTLIDSPSSGGYLPEIRVGNSIFTLEILQAKTTGKARIDIITSISGIDSSSHNLQSISQGDIEVAAEAIVAEQIEALITKPFGNPLPHKEYRVNVALNSTGLIKRNP